MGHEWLDISEGFFECGYQTADGRIELLPKYKKIVASILSSPKSPSIFDGTRSKYLLGAYISTDLKSGGAAYFNANGKGHRVKFFDNGPDYFKNGLARHLVKDKLGFINKRGDIVIPAQYDFVTPFLDGYARQCIGCKQQAMGEHTSIVGGEWKHIDKKSNTVIAPQLAPIVIEEIDKLGEENLACQQFCNTEKSRTIYKNECGKGDDKACVGYAKLLGELVISGWALGGKNMEFSGITYSTHLNFNGLASEDQDQITKKLLQKYCYENSYSETCGVLAILEYNDGNIELGLELLKNSCEQNISWACSNLGYLKDLEFKHDEAYQLYTKACTLGNQVACYNSGTSEYKFNNLRQAKTTFHKACAGGFETSCKVKEQYFRDD